MGKCSIIELVYVIMPIKNNPVQKGKYNTFFYCINLIFIKREKKIPMFVCSSNSNNIKISVPETLPLQICE